jgi:predicted transposase YdaD
MTQDQPASDFDGAWKYALEQQFDTFLAFFFPQAYAAIDWQRPVVVRDSELQQVAPEDQAGKQRVDRLVEVYRLDGEPALVLVHIEIQAQRDSAFASRMFRYHARLFDRARLPVASLAILGDTVADWRPDRFGYALWGCELGLRFPMVKLLDFDEAQLAATPNLFATLTLLHRDAQATRRNPEERLRRKVTRFRALLRQGHRAEDIRVMLRLMEHLLRLGPSFAETARTAMRQVEVEETGMDTFVTSFEEIGEARGRVAGRAEGQRDLVLRLLDRKIGPLSADLRAQVAALAPEVLLELSDALLDFTSVDELTDWLQQR